MYSNHGEWKIIVDNNIVFQSFKGSWNEEAVLAYIKEFRQKTFPLSKGKWAILSIFEDWELGTPDIEKHVIEHCEWFKEHGCVKDCHVYSPNVLIEMQLEKMISQTEKSYERRVFSSMQSAISWLAIHNFTCSKNTDQKGLTYLLSSWDFEENEV